MRASGSGEGLTDGVDPHLVVDGPNRLTRNPMYLGLTGLLLSHAIARRSPSALIPLAGFVWLIDRHQIPAEEKALEERFGQDYLDYKEAVPRWLGIPGVSTRPRSCAAPRRNANPFGSERSRDTQG